MWYSVFNLENGRLYSVGTEIAEEVPEEFGVVETEEEPQVALWDEETRQYAAKG